MQIIQLHTQPFKISIIKGIFLLIALLSFIVMMNLDYDRDFAVTALLPLAYLLFLFFIINDNVLHDGIGALSVLSFYCFRMCILPVVCALGNFYLEPDKKDYIGKYDMAIYLTCFETLIVFLSLSYFCTYYGKTVITHKIVPKCRKFTHSPIFVITIISTLFIIIVCTVKNIHYFHFLTEEMEGAILSDQAVAYQEMHAIWYIIDFMCTFWRPLFSFTIIYMLSKKEGKASYFFIFLIALLNVLFLSDRRIYSLLIGSLCFYYLMIFIKSRKVKKYILITILICAFYTIYYSFYTSTTTSLEMLARTFQRYFSGPTLTAMALEVNSRIGLQFYEFFKLLLNDFQSFSAFVGTFSLPDYYFPTFGMSKGLWTPMVAGCIRYFGPLFPLVIIFIVRYIVKCDYEIRRTDNELYKMLYSYIAVVISCYMIMYTIELIIYFMLSHALIYRFLIFFDSKKVNINS